MVVTFAGSALRRFPHRGRRAGQPAVLEREGEASERGAEHERAQRHQSADGERSGKREEFDRRHVKHHRAWVLDPALNAFPRQHRPNR